MHPPLIYCPRSTEFKFHVVEEQECHLHPHHTSASHLGVNGMDTAFSVSPSASTPSSEGDATGRYAGNHTSPLSVPNEATQPTGANHQPAANEGVVNGSSWNQSITPSHASDESHEWTANSWNRQSESFEDEGLMPHYNNRQSSFNGYRTNRAYSGAPFDYRYHSHSDPQQQYYPYQQAAIEPIEYSPPNNLPRHAYMEVEGPSRNHRYQGSTASAHSHFDYNRRFPESTYGRNVSVPESNPLRHRTALKSFFDPQATSFNYGKTNRNLPSNPQADILNTEAYTRYKSQKCRESLEQLQRSNKAAYYNCSHHGNSQGAATNDDQTMKAENGHSWVGNPQPESSSVNGGYSATNAGYKPRSRSRSWSEPFSRQESTSKVSSSITQEDNNLHHQDGESNNKGKGKEVMRNPATSRSNMSTPSSSLESVARVGLWNEYRDAGTQTDDHPVHRTVRDQLAKFFRYVEVGSPLKASQSFDKANSHGDLASTESIVNSDSTNLGILSVKTESGDEDSKAGDHSEYTPMKLKMDPDDEVKLHDIPSAPAGQGAPDPVRSGDTEWDADTENRYNELETPSASSKSQIMCPNGVHTPRSTSERRSQPTKQDDATLGVDAQRSDILRIGRSSIPRSASSNTARSGRSWSAVVSGRYIPSKPSGLCSPQPTASVGSPSAAAAQTMHEGLCNASSVASRDEASPLPSNASISRSLEPVERTLSPETMNADREHRPPNDSNWASEVVSLLSGSSQAVEGPDNVSTASDNVMGMAESTMHKEIDETASGASQPDSGVDIVAPALLTRSENSPQLSETTPTASASTSVAPEPPSKPQPRLWSQVLGGSKSAGHAKSDSSKDEVNWPSLGSGGPGKGPKRNTTS
ncbi:hypothetical protein F4782DRAFT_552433 [Xylaria castorea]|nr:hypothetical protein F4782DRAFT_552433 [Xylaria castorea]